MKKIQVVLLCSFLFACLFPTTALAASTITIDDAYVDANGSTYDISANPNLSVYIATTKPVTLIQTSGNVNTNVKITCTIAGVDLTINGVNLDSVGMDTYCVLSFTGIDNTLTLVGDNILTSGFDYPGVHVSQSNVLEIKGSGKLTASSQTNGAGIGSASGQNAGHIIISGGTIIANGGFGAAGIGGGLNGGATLVTINGGHVTATGGDSGAGIGSGMFSDCGYIIISGGEVFASRGTEAPYDIGSGKDASSTGTIEFNNEAVVFLKNNARSGSLSAPSHILHTNETIMGSAAYGYIVPSGWSGIAYAYLPAHLVTYNAGLHGSLSGDTTEAVMDGDSPSDDPTVNSHTGYTFSAWSDGTTTSSNLNDFIINSDTTLTAQYDVVNVTGVTLDATTSTLTKGDADETNDNIQLNATVLPTNSLNKDIEWTSSNPLVATVSSSGLVSLVKKGTTTITVTTDDNSKTATCAITVNQAVEDITLNKTSETLILGDSDATNNTVTLTATINPTDANNQNYTFSSNSIAVATVDLHSGVVTAQGAGTATITVTSSDVDEHTDTCEITVEQKADGVNIDLASATLVLGDADATNDDVQLIATVSPATTSNKDVTWSSSNETVATVNLTGLVTAIKAGDVTITATADDGGFTDTCTIRVEQRVTGVSLITNALTFEKGVSDTLVCTIEPASATDTSVTWTSDNTNVATIAVVDDVTCMITAKDYGKANITVTTTDGTFTDICVVSVQESSNDESAKHGSVTGKLIDSDSNGLANYKVTLYSTPKTVTTSSSGVFSYSNVAFTKHTLVIQSPSGTEIERYSLTFNESATIGSSISGNNIVLNYTATTSNITLNFQANSSLNGFTFTGTSFVNNPDTGDEKTWLENIVMFFKELFS